MGRKRTFKSGEGKRYKRGRGNQERDMCLAIPALIKSIEDKEAEAEIGGITRRISLWLTPEAKVGDYVLVHTGYAINVLDQEEAEETLALLREIAEGVED
jgi:hydrogenase expression/formation protein HypC